MSIRCLIITLFITCLSSSFANDQFNIKDRVLTFNYLEETKDLIFSHPEYDKDKNFIKLLTKIKKEKREEIQKSIIALEKIMPSKLIKPIIYWNYISRDKKQLRKVLTYIMMYKSLLIRDYIDAPLTNQIEVKRASSFLKTFYKELSLTSHNIAMILLPKFRKIASSISEQKNNSIILSMIIDHPYLTQSFSSLFPNFNNYIINDFGYIPGNTVSRVKQKVTKLRSLIAGAKKSLFIHLESLKNQIDKNGIDFFTKLIKSREKELGHRLSIFIILDKDLKIIDRYHNLSYLKMIETLRLSLHVKLISNHQKRFPAQLSNQSSMFSISQTGHTDMVIIDGETAYINLNQKFTTITKGPIVSLYQYAYLSRYQPTKVPKELEIDDSAQTSQLIFNYSKEFYRLKNEILIAKISMIQNAHNSIFISTSSLKDPRIINALIKIKTTRPKIKINILVHEKKNQLGYDHIIYFLTDLASKNIPVRIIQNKDEEIQEVISIDGKSILYFSNHPGIINFQGFDIKTISDYDQYFQSLFVNKKITKKLNIKGYRIKKANSHDLTEDDIYTQTAIGTSILKNQKSLFGR